jgi:hypothetical protein
MSQTYLRGTGTTTHRVDLPCDATGLGTPPAEVHIKLFPSGDQWTLMAHTQAGKLDGVAKWLRQHTPVLEIRMAPGLAPKMLRARLPAPPPAWSAAAAHVRVQYLELAPDGHASWFIEGTREAVQGWLASMDGSPALEGAVRCRPVAATLGDAHITRRQFQVLSVAVALGYYEVPHCLDLRTLATRVGISLGSVSELLRRGEAAVITNYVDSNVLRWPTVRGEPTPPRTLESLVTR